MKFKILGLPSKREEFKICHSYKGTERNSMPDFRNVVKSKEDLYLDMILYEEDYDGQIPVSELLEIADNVTKSSNEPFEQILLKNIGEEVPEYISCKSLGYEVIASNDASMIHFWLRNDKDRVDDLYKTFKKKLNGNFLFSCIKDAEEFINEIRPYSHLVSHYDIDYEVVEIAKVEGVKY